MSFPTRGAVTRGAAARALRRVLQETTRENIDPEPGAEVNNLEDELAISDVEWQQAYNELQEKLKTLEENNQKLQDSLQREIHLVITSLMAEIIDIIERKGNHHKKNHMEHFEEQHNIKKPKLS